MLILYRKMEGIYAIFNKSKSKVYIGSSVNLNKRRTAHFSALKRNQHHNIKLQNYYNKYGVDCIEFVVLEEIKNASNLDLMDREGYFIKFYKEKISVFNCIEIFDRKKTFKMSIEGRRKISKALTGRVRTEEHKFNLRKNANYEAMALKNTGKKRNEVQINNIRIGQLKSKHKRHSRRVNQIDKQTKSIIKVWESIKEASIKLNLDCSNIVKAIRGTKFTCGGFCWEYCV